MGINWEYNISFIFRNNGTTKILTKGDNNAVDDRGLYPPGQLWLDKDDVMGRARGFLPYAGIITIYMNEYPYFKVYFLLCKLFIPNYYFCISSNYYLYSMQSWAFWHSTFYYTANRSTSNSITFQIICKRLKVIFIYSQYTSIYTIVFPNWSKRIMFSWFFSTYE